MSDDRKLTPPASPATPPARPPPALPSPVNVADITEIVDLAPSPLPTISISPSSAPGVQTVTLAPNTKIENYGPPPSPLAMLIRVSPYLLAIGGFILWGAMGKTDPASAAGFITAFVLACLNARGGGPTLGAAIAKNAGDALRKAFGSKKGAPPK